MVRIMGEQVSPYGYGGKVVLIAPGALAAQASMAIPAYARPAEDLIAAILFQGSDGTAAALATNMTVVARGTAAPSAGQACVYDDNNLRIGNATTTRDFLIAVIRYKSFTVEV